MKALLIHSRMLRTAMALALLTCAANAWASDAATSASAGSASNRSRGTASATAHYTGDVGFARTDTRTGTVNAARAVAVGVDEHGLSLSVSTAIASRLGPAIATNFNLTINTGGEAAVSVGSAVARGGAARTVATGGSAVSRPATPTATSSASGKTTSGGTVRVRTEGASTPHAYVPAPERSREHSREPIAPRRVIRISAGH